MKLRRLALLISLSGLICSCSFLNTKNNNGTPQEETPSEKQEEEGTEQEQIDEELAKFGEIKSGSFNFENGVINSTKDVSLFLLKKTFGYGTFTFFGKGHQIFEKVIISPDNLGFFSLLASIPGALIFSSVLLFIHIFVRNEFDILFNSEENK